MRGDGVNKNSVFSVQFSHKPKTALKRKSLKRWGLPKVILNDTLGQLAWLKAEVGKMKTFMFKDHQGRFLKT